MKRKFLGALLTLCMISAFVPCMAQAKNGTKYGDWLYYEVNADGTGVTIASCDINATQVVIPDKIENLPVTMIGDNAFEYIRSLTSVIIPNSVTSIGSGAFRHCASLMNVTIPDGLTSIGDNAFEGCSSLTNIYLPDSVTSIGGWAFYETGYYNNASNWENNVLYIGNYLIAANNEVSGNYIIKSTTQTIADSAFYECKLLTEVTIPDGIERINDYMFYNCTALTSVEIPESVTSIGIYAFWLCSSLTDVTIPEGVTTIGHGAFRECLSLTNIIIPDNVISIGSSAFYKTGYYNDNSNWNDNVLYIGNHLIEASSQISGNYEIKNGTKIIADSAFHTCYNLTSVTIPNGLISIGESAFSECMALTDVTIPDSVTSIGGYAFYRCKKLTSIEIPNGVTTIGEYTFYECSSLINAEIPNGITSIGDWAFRECSALANAIIPDSVTSIGEFAYGDCTALTSITIPDSVTSIGMGVFIQCDGLNINVSENNPDYCDIDGILFNKEKTEIVSFANSKKSPNYKIPNGVTTIGDWAFNSCKSLTEITIPNGVKEIAYSAFGGCEALTSITMPTSVNSIANYAFYHSGATNVYYNGSQADWNDINIGQYNEPLKNARIHYNYVRTDPDTYAISDIQAASGGMKLTVMSNKSVSGEQIVIVAYYDADGVFLNFETQPITYSEMEQTVSFNGNENAASVKVFIWNAIDSMMPASASAEVEIASN